MADHTPVNCPRCLGTGYINRVRTEQTVDGQGKQVSGEWQMGCPVCHGQKTVHPLRVAQYNIDQAEAAKAFGLPD